MATTTVRPPGRGAKPGRSMTHPLRESKAGGTRRVKNNGEQFDPDELRRKLEAYLAEEKKKSEQRRAKAKAHNEGAYHHIPKVAAADFERTATPELMGQKDKRKRYIHRLAQAALKHHAEESIFPATGSFDLRKTQAMDHIRKQRELIGDRNQFQRTRELEDAAQIDKGRNLNRVPQRTFGTNHLEVAHKTTHCRPLSTGDLDLEEYTDANDQNLNTKMDPQTLLSHAANDRQDWEQRDEVPVEAHRSVKERVGPFLRKPDSMWILKSKKEQKGQIILNGESNPAPPTGDTKQKRNIFLGLFRR